MIYYEITDEVGKIVASNMGDFQKASKYRDQKSFVAHMNGVGCKGVHEVLDNIGIWIVVEDERDLLKSPKILRRVFDFYKNVAVGICSRQREQILGARHILPNIHTQMTQAMDFFTENNPGIFFAESFKTAKDNISDFVQKKPEETAHLIANLNKLMLDMGAHLRGIDIVHFGKEYKPEMKEVRIRAAILNQYSSFAKEFDEAFLTLRVNTIDETATVVVDKNMFSLVMYNLLSNALKYCMPESEVRFHFDDDKKELNISMISLRIESDEIDGIFEEGVRGKHAMTSPGSGVGLFVVKKSLECMRKPPMKVNPNYQKTQSLNSEHYVENHFHLNLN